MATRRMPPRDPKTGRFRKRKAAAAPRRRARKAKRR